MELLHVLGNTWAAVAAGCREPTWKNQAKLAKEIPL